MTKSKKDLTVELNETVEVLDGPTKKCGEDCDGGCENCACEDDSLGRTKRRHTPVVVLGKSETVNGIGLDVIKSLSADGRKRKTTKYNFSQLEVQESMFFQTQEEDLAKLLQSLKNSANTAHKKDPSKQFKVSKVSDGGYWGDEFEGKQGVVILRIA